MISVVIASVNEDQLSAVKENIGKTIGVEFEVLSFANSGGEKGLCEIYNRGAEQAKYNLLCYMHEDIEIKTIGWGKKVVDLFAQQPKTGVVGVAGCAYKSFAPSGWGAESFEVNLVFQNYMQHFKHSDKPSIHAYSNPDGKSSEKVVSVDGMWFCTTKEIVDQVGFDEETFKGFHCYDLDFCLNVGQFYDVVVTFEVLMEHFSEGGYNRDWFFETLKLQKKWEHTLPRSVVQLSQENIKLIEKRAYKRLLSKLVDLKFEKKYILELLNLYREKTGMDKGLYLKLRYYLFGFLYLGKKVK